MVVATGHRQSDGGSGGSNIIYIRGDLILIYGSISLNCSGDSSRGILQYKNTSFLWENRINIICNSVSVLGGDLM